jgi:SpoVK/Ycf46/Vps4 family AAA+-type ATPase
MPKGKGKVKHEPTVGVKELVVSDQSVASWLADACKHERRAVSLEQENQFAAAMSYYYLAAQALAYSLQVFSFSQERAAACMDSSSRCVQMCAQNDNTASVLAQKMQYLTSKGEVMSKRYCKERASMLAEVTGSAEEGGAECDANMRAMLEQTFAKGSEACKNAWFDLILGQQRAKDAIINGFQRPLQFPNLFSKQSKAILMYGSPGTGKTLMAKALANELSQDGNVRLLMFAPQHSDIKSKYFGESEQKISQIFKCASYWACKQEEMNCGEGEERLSPRVMAVIFIDEVEVLAGDRASDKTGLGGSTLNTLLQEMDGIKSYDNVLVVAATNYPWQLDSAFLRRFTSSIFVELPTAKDIFQFCQMQISKAIRGFDPDKNKAGLVLRSDEESRCGAKAPKTSREACETCTPEDKQKGLAESSITGYKMGEYARFVRNLNEGALMNVCTRFHNMNYSLSDMANVVAKVSRDVGQDALSKGTFIKETINGQELYVSTLCYDSDELKKRTAEGKGYRFPIDGSNGIPYIRFGDKLYVHQGVHPFAIGGHDSRVVNNNIFVRTTKTTTELLVQVAFRKNIVATDKALDIQPPAAWSDVNKRAQGAVFRWIQGHFSTSDSFSWSDMQKVYNLISDKGYAGSIEDMVREIAKYQSTVFIEYAWIHGKIEQSLGLFWNSNFDAQNKALSEAVGENGVIDALLEKSQEISIYSTWGQPDGTAALTSSFKTSVGTIRSSPSKQALKLLDMLKDSTQYSKEDILTDFEPVTMVETAGGQSYKEFYDPYVPMSLQVCLKASIAGVPDESGAGNACPIVAYELNDELQVTNYKPKPMPFESGDLTEEKKADKDATNLEQAWHILPPNASSRVVNWNYTHKHFVSACMEVKSSADPQMIEMLKLYSKDPSKILECIASTTRAKLPEDCQKQVDQALKARKKQVGNNVGCN